MKKLLFALLLLSTSIAPAQDPRNRHKDPPNYGAQFTLTAHVICSHIAGGGMTMDVLIDGKKYQLTGDVLKDEFLGDVGVLNPGDYPAMLLPPKNMKKNPKSYLSVQRYELLFPDKSHAEFYVTGISE